MQDDEARRGRSLLATLQIREMRSSSMSNRAATCPTDFGQREAAMTDS